MSRELGWIVLPLSVYSSNALSHVEVGTCSSILISQMVKMAKGERWKMDRVDWVLLVFPFLPLADLLSTLFSLSLGGEEVGILARSVLASYGFPGLGMLAICTSIIFLCLIRIITYIKEFYISDMRFRGIGYTLSIPIFWFFMLEGVYVSTVALNFLAPFDHFLTQSIALRGVIAGAYFVSVVLLTKSHLNRLPRR